MATHVVRVGNKSSASSRILTGDFRALGRSVGAATVDLIVVDPPYGQSATPVYGALAKFGARVLRPGGLCAAYSDALSLPEHLRLMTKHLQFVWTCVAVRRQGIWRRFRENLFAATTPVLLFVRPQLNAWWRPFRDVFEVACEPGDHGWQESVAQASYLIRTLCPPGGLVCDPLCGTGPTGVAAKRLGRQFLGIEKDPARARQARVRLKNVPPIQRPA